MSLAAAAAATLAAGTCRFRHTVTTEPPQRFSFDRTETGEADLTGWRARFVTTADGGPDALAEMIMQRWPWLADLEDDDDAGPVETVVAGAASWYGDSGRMGDPEAGPTEGHPLWILTAPATDGDGWRVEVTELQVDDESRIRRVDWVVHPRFRPRALYTPTSRQRHGLELWDLGAAIDVPLPTTGPRPNPPAREAARDLVKAVRWWRRHKREWEAREVHD